MATVAHLFGESFLLNAFMSRHPAVSSVPDSVLRRHECVERHEREMRWAREFQRLQDMAAENDRVSRERFAAFELSVSSPAAEYLPTIFAPPTCGALNDLSNGLTAYWEREQEVQRAVQTSLAVERFLGEQERIRAFLEPMTQLGETTAALKWHLDSVVDARFSPPLDPIQQRLIGRLSAVDRVSFAWLDRTSAHPAAFLQLPRRRWTEETSGHLAP